MPEKTKETFVLSKFLFDVLLDLLIVVILVVGIRAFFFAPFQIDGPSMCNTLNIYNEECFNGPGERILTSRMPTWNLFGWRPVSLEKGDIIVFHAPHEEKSYIKRIIATEGDTIKIEDGKVFILADGDIFVEMNEPYLNSDNRNNTDLYRSNSETYIVPDGQYFVMGDNRVRSSDSRRCFRQLGCDGDASPFLDHSNIQGKAKMVIFPFSHIRILSSTGN
jgi:signal peptidase I